MIKSLLCNISTTRLKKGLNSKNVALAVSTELPAVIKILLSYGELQSENLKKKGEGGTKLQIQRSLMYIKL